MAKRREHPNASEHLAALIMAPDRLTSDKLQALPAADRTLYTEGRQIFLNEWFALIELGIVEPVWSTFAQRLNYVIERAGREQQDLAKAAKISPQTLSGYLNRKRSAINQGVDEDSITIARNVLAILRVTNLSIELPWVLGGTRAGDTRTFKGRYKIILEAYFGDDWFKSARTAGLLPDEMETNAKSPMTNKEEMKLANALIALIGPAITTTWLLNGKVEPPEAIRSSMDLILAEGPITRWDTKMDEHVSVWMTPRTLMKLVELVEKHVAELPADVAEQIRRGLWWPLAKYGVMTPTLYITEPEDHLTEDRIRERREGIFKVFRML